MSDTKWADVAHYYLKSGIKCNVYRGDLTEKQGDCRQSVEKFGAKHLRVNSDGMTFWCVPILRHFEDMAEAEAREIFQMDMGCEFSPYYDGHTALVWWNLSDYMDGCSMSSSQILIGDPSVWHWLISRGFDMFGLIESGQAIRKEVGNGNI